MFNPNVYETTHCAFDTKLQKVKSYDWGKKIKRLISVKNKTYNSIESFFIAFVYFSISFLLTDGKKRSLKVQFETAVTEVGALYFLLRDTIGQYHPSPGLTLGGFVAYLEE